MESALYVQRQYIDYNSCKFQLERLCCMEMLQNLLVQLLSHARLFETPWTAAHQASQNITNSRSLLKLMSTEQVMPSKHLILSRPLLLPPSIFPNIRIFSNESALPIRRPKYWSFSLNISPSNEYSGLISFRMDWLDLLAVQENYYDFKHIFLQTKWTIKYTSPNSAH